MKSTFSSDACVASWLAAALIAMPFLQALPVDFDRSGVLILLAPALWAGRDQLVRGTSDLLRGPLWLRALLGVAAIAVVISTFRAAQPAPASVTAATWLLLAAAGVIAGQTIRNEASASRRLLAGIALGAAAGTLAVWYLWVSGGRGAIPLYAHPRHLGLHTLVGAIASTALILDAGAQRRRQLLWLAVGAIVWAGVLWSGGRTPLIAVLGGLVVWFIFRRQARRGLAWATALQLAAGLALSIAFWTPRAELGWWHALDRTSAAIATGSTSDLSSARSDFWKETAERAQAAPWLGHGADSYRFLMPKLDGQQPHNLALQLWLDLGMAGAAPLLVFLAIILVGGCTRPATLENRTDPWLALVTACIVGGMLDGVFYHLLAFLPAMLAIGASLPLPSGAASPGRHAMWLATLGASTAALIVALHSWIFYQLALAEPPPPTSTIARCVRAFPSSTFGLSRWLDAWRVPYPEQTWEWIRWAETHSAGAPSFHIYAARVLLAEGNPDAAETELMTARDKAHRSARPAIEGMLETVRSLSR